MRAIEIPEGRGCSLASGTVLSALQQQLPEFSHAAAGAATSPRRLCRWGNQGTERQSNGPRSRSSCSDLLEETLDPKCGPPGPFGRRLSSEALRPARLLEQSPVGSRSPLEHLSAPPDPSSEAASSREPSLTASHRHGTQPGNPRAGSSSRSSQDRGPSSVPASSPDTEPIRDAQEGSVANANGQEHGTQNGPPSPASAGRVAAPTRVH